MQPTATRDEAAIPPDVIESITVIGRRWFQRSAGNTYHSAEIHVNGVPVHKLDCVYGYGNQYLWNAFTWLDRNGWIDLETFSNGCVEAPWRYCDRRGITLTDTVSDVARKMDL